MFIDSVVYGRFPTLDEVSNMTPEEKGELELEMLNENTKLPARVIEERMEGNPVLV